MTTTISKEAKVLTFINTFTMESTNQTAVVDLLRQITDTVVRHQPGFVSSSLHRSQDGKRVVMYAQWASEEAYQAMRANMESKALLDRVMSMASFEPGAFDVVETFEGNS